MNWKEVAVWCFGLFSLIVSVGSISFRGPTLINFTTFFIGVAILFFSAEYGGIGNYVTSITKSEKK